MAVFKGYMRVYIRTEGSSTARVEYTEDWLNSRKRAKILGKARRFILTFYMYNVHGQHIVQTVPLDQKVERDFLNDIIHQRVEDIKQEYPTEDFVLSKSYVNIRA